MHKGGRDKSRSSTEEGTLKLGGGQSNSTWMEIEIELKGSKQESEGVGEVVSE